ncbi:hypothetical protein HanIR_Chr16g0835031 [Helianthus annuus]|nr:hypothetical protein HanIR_Chr16g0835031 [Helianthus annuus]
MTSLILGSARRSPDGFTSDPSPITPLALQLLNDISPDEIVSTASTYTSPLSF